MAHKFRVKPVPHKNKDGSLSKSKRDYVVIDRTRKGSRVVGVVSSEKAAVDLIAEERQRLIGEHVKKHPRDAAFRRQLYVKGAKNV